MKQIDPIAKASRLLRRGKYGEAVQTLEPEIVRYRDHFQYYYILAVACLYLNDFGGALTYFTRAREIKMRFPAVLLGLAALHLRRGETDRAIDLYLEVRDLDPKNRTVTKALRVIRKHRGAENIFSWVESGNLRKLYPPRPRPPFAWKRFIAAAAVLAVLGAGFAVLFTTGVLTEYRGRGSDRQGLSATLLGQEERNTPVEVEVGGSTGTSSPGKRY
jgi:tetratricopeptide (TPR) repeat protein